ncbi:MAG: DUF6434 domain-containing protein [Paucimonas sp.]|jgi:hypothetical protein|uniref:DUF6434 domain-containing protein n=1 Tax=Pantoea sp. Cy-639 TaxID=2608360 RepID=UPI001421940F|nr:DUF6434 domain-containing protein [Pantoea sp. Cy-639]MDR2308303.1 DUF6434 domain-containing protein [Paucimonas sp.]NIF15535.1 hypothetical protein [Pantoea sp. Cy-639]
MTFDWHAGPITRATRLDKHYRNTQRVRQFLREECGETFRFDRAFMAWIKRGEALTMGDVADEWRRRHLA